LRREEAIGVQVEGKALGVYIVGEQVYALGDYCPHEKGVRLSDGWIEDGQIVCPMHQSTFELGTGRCTAAPADEDVPAYPAEVRGDMVWVAVES
jgi:nitrite reductase/ring-hydroxylating ferredoxin subunit